MPLFELDDINRKILQNLPESPRNLMNVARKIGFPNSTIYNRMLKMIPQLKEDGDLDINLRVRPNIDFGLLGLTQYIVVAPYHWSSQRRRTKILKNLSRNSLGLELAHVSGPEDKIFYKSLVSKRHFPVPPQSSKSVVSTYFPDPDFTFFDKKNLVWRIDKLMDPESGEKMIELVDDASKKSSFPRYSRRSSFDDVNLLILAELYKDGRVKLSELARNIVDHKLRPHFTLQGVKVRYDKDLFGKFIRGYSVMYNSYPGRIPLGEIVHANFSSESDLNRFANASKYFPFVKRIEKIEDTAGAFVYLSYPSFIDPLKKLQRHGRIRTHLHYPVTEGIVEMPTDIFSAYNFKKKKWKF